MLFCVVGDSLVCLPVDMDVWYGGMVACDMSSHLLQVKTVSSTDKLAQASWSRLGENSRGSPKPFSTNGHPGDTLCFWASEHLAQARGVSPKRDPASASASFSSPRLGEGGARVSEYVSAERDPSAWARRWARQRWVWMFVYFWMICFGGCECYDEGHVYNEVWYIRSMIHEL